MDDYEKLASDVRLLYLLSMFLNSVNRACERVCWVTCRHGDRAYVQ